MGSRKIQGFTAGIVASSIWGGMYVVSKVVLQYIPPFSLLTLRLLLGILVLGFVYLMRPGYKLSKAQTISVILVGVVGFGISLGFQFLGTSLSTASNASVVTSSTPAFVFVFASLILKERITSMRLLALLVSTIGVLIIIDPFSADLSLELFWGNLSLVTAALTWAWYSVLIRRSSRGFPILQVSLVALAGGLLVSLPLALLEIRQTGWWVVNSDVIYGVLYLGIVSTALAFFLWNKAFEILEAGPAGLTFFAQPIVGGLLGWYFLGDEIDVKFLLGGVLILAGIWLVSSEQ